jgi:molybdopterin converting factor subunit 1
MYITLRYFAGLREAIGYDNEAITVPEGTTGSSLREIVRSSHPIATNILSRCVIACNREFMREDIEIKDGDEIVFIPPMAGGSP